jgi:ketosteroid isomerase-like protein
MNEVGDLLRRYYREVWIEGRMEALDELVAEDYRDHDPPRGFGSDRESAGRLVEAFRAGMTDASFTILAIVAAGDSAAAHWLLEWTQAGPLLGDPAADGRRLRLRGSDLIRVRDGRIAEIHHVEDMREPG